MNRPSGKACLFGSSAYSLLSFWHVDNVFMRCAQCYSFFSGRWIFIRFSLERGFLQPGFDSGLCRCLFIFFRLQLFEIFFTSAGVLLCVRDGFSVDLFALRGLVLVLAAVGSGFLLLIGVGDLALPFV
nr:hypothetical protein KXZ65_01815 [Pectobacterium sp. PL152]